MNRAGCRNFTGARLLTSCPVCESSELRFYVVARDRHYSIHGEFSTDRCEGCGLVFLNPMPSVDDLGQLYPTSYYSYQSPSLPSGFGAYLRSFLRMKKRTAVPPFKLPGVMLDVGCGAGHYLLEMQQRGWRVYGSELSEQAAAAGRKAGLDIRGGELRSASFGSGMFDFVRLNHSFEHMPDPHSVLTEIRRILKDGGRLFIGVPNINGLAARVFRGYWWNFGVPVHTYNYNPSNLVRLLERHGFVVERVRYYSDYAGLLGSLQIYLNRNKTPGVSTGPLLSNWLLKLPAQYAARLLDALRLGDCIEVICTKGDDEIVGRG